MKKSLLAIMFLLSLCLGANAQLKVDFGSFAVGPTVNFGINSDYKNAGAGLQVQKFFGDHLRGVVHGDYYLRNNHLSMIEFGADFHYVFPLAKNIGVYPIVGLGYSILKFKGVNEIPEGITILPDDYADEEEGKLHFNLGAGCEYYITPSFKAFGEVKYHHISDYGRALLSVGVAYVW